MDGKRDSQTVTRGSTHQPPTIQPCPSGDGPPSILSGMGTVLVLQNTLCLSLCLQTNDSELFMFAQFHFKVKQINVSEVFFFNIN